MDPRLEPSSATDAVDWAVTFEAKQGRVSECSDASGPLGILFDDGQTLDDCDDLLGINALMEHSFVGDLTLQVACPDGTQVLRMENNNSGADECSEGTDVQVDNLGDHDDCEGTPLQPVMGYWYTYTVVGT